MASSMISQRPVETEWESNTWKAENVTKIVASSKDMIEVVNTRPGENGKLFSAVVHKELLCYFSAYYTAALKGGFAEAQKKTVKLYLPYDRMTDLVSWLYSDKIIAVDPKELCELYAFADEKMMLAFRRSIMTKLIESNELDQMEEDAMSYVKRLPENCGLFRYLVDYWVGVWARTDYRTEMAEWDSDGRIPRKFFYAALEKFAGLSVQDRPREEQGDHKSCLAIACNYHEHPNKTEWLESTRKHDTETSGKFVLTEAACLNDLPCKAYYTEQ